MSKIGEGNPVPEEPTIQQYRKELEKNASKFLKALDQYEVTQDKEERAHLKAVMDRSLALISNAAREINRDGIRKQEVNVEKDYKAFISDETIEHLTALKEDLSCLRDNNKLP
jgi:hypothetical protein